MKNQNTYLPEDILVPCFGKDTKLIGVEIGVLGGSGTVAMLDRLPNLTLYAIDPFQHFDNKAFEAERPQEYHDTNYTETLKRLKEFGDRVILLKMKSDDALNSVPDQIDFVFIDGDHSEDQVLRDIENWQQKLKPRSILAGHDYQIDYIARIVNEKFGNKVKLGDDLLWWVEFENNKVI